MTATSSQSEGGSSPPPPERRGRGGGPASGTNQRAGSEPPLSVRLCAPGTCVRARAAVGRKTRTAAGKMAAEEEESAVCSEVDVLQSIYLDEICVSHDSSRVHPWEISITLYPATADDAESQYVCFTLILSLTSQYPDDAPVISIRNSRGLSDDRIQSIYQALMDLAEAGAGGQVLYQLIEKGKEILTNNNVPHCQCVICLECFQEDEAFTKTACYHYFHSYCLAQYIRHSEAEFLAERRKQKLTRPPEHELKLAVLCPVCREPLTYDLGLLLAAAAPNRPLEPYRPDEKSLKKQLELQLIFQRQQEKGGIIDPEAERNRFFISLAKPVTSQSPEEQEEERGERPGNRSPTASDPERAPALTEGPCPRRGGRAGGRGWAGARPRPLADRLEGAPPQEQHRLAAGPDTAARDGGSPARGRRNAEAPERGLPDRREAAPRAQQRRPCPRRDWSEGRGRWRGGGRGRAKQAEAWGPGEVSSLEPGPR